MGVRGINRRSESGTGCSRAVSEGNWEHPGEKEKGGLTVSNPHFHSGNRRTSNRRPLSVGGMPRTLVAA